MHRFVTVLLSLPEPNEPLAVESCSTPLFVVGLNILNFISIDMARRVCGVGVCVTYEVRALGAALVR